MHEVMKISVVQKLLANHIIIQCSVLLHLLKTGLAPAKMRAGERAENPTKIP